MIFFVYIVNKKKYDKDKKFFKEVESKFIV